MEVTLKDLFELFASMSQNNNSNSSSNSSNSSGINDFAVGQEVVIRTYSAGVWFGKLEKKVGGEIILKDARRMWSWWAKESISLSAVVKHGIIQDNSKIAGAIDSVWLQPIEIMPITGSAADSIRNAPEVEQE